MQKEPPLFGESLEKEIYSGQRSDREQEKREAAPFFPTAQKGQPLDSELFLHDCPTLRT
jgi:hypothetical protein